MLVDLTAENPRHYKAFFTQGLRQHSDCFRISATDEMSEPFPTQNQPDSFTLGVLTDTGELAGVVSFQREGDTREKIRHKGLLFRMYVSAQYGGRGLGRQLVEEVIRRARQQTDIEQINLTVVATNTSARRLYESVGFQPFALERNALKQGSTYYDEAHMALFLNR